MVLAPLLNPNPFLDLYGPYRRPDGALLQTFHSTAFALPLDGVMLRAAVQAKPSFQS